MMLWGKMIGVVMKRPLESIRLLGPVLEFNQDSGITAPTPSTSQQAVRVFTPTKDTPTSQQLNRIQSKINGNNLVESSVTLERVSGGIMSSADEAGRGPVEFPHVSLDVTETNIKNELGIKEKSTLIAANPEMKTLQSCFAPVEGQFSQEATQQIGKLVSFVTGLDARAEQVEQRLYINSNATQFNHIALDIMEIVSSRVAFENNINIRNNSMLIRSP
jgi:hypothetical protein